MAFLDAVMQGVILASIEALKYINCLLSPFYIQKDKNETSLFKLIR